MNILCVAAEVSPFSKVGGLGDVLGALPVALAKKGVSVKIITPAYGIIDRRKFSLKETSDAFEVKLGGMRIPCSVLKWSHPEFPNHEVYFIENETYFACRNVYNDKHGNLYVDNAERFVLLQKAVLEMIDRMNWIPDIIHCHDNHSALIPVYLKTCYDTDPKFRSIKTILTIHNVAYQSITPFDKRYIFGLPSFLFAPMEAMEWYNMINPLKAGIIFADAVSTVSNMHAQEIVTDSVISAGLKDILLNRKEPIYGILNGVDCSEWDPATDMVINAHYSSEDLTGKQRNKQSLIREMDLNKMVMNKPLLVMVSRLVEQKGIDLLLDCVDRLMAMDIGFIILGSGEEKYQVALKEITSRFPGKFSVNFGFNPSLAHKILAGADILVMPSRYEPCGITQMHALKYGTVPVVHRTGGLADTVKQWNGVEGNGFLFDDYHVEAFLASVSEALRTFKDKAEWKKIVRNGMNEDFSWDKSAEEYLKLYASVMAK